MAKKTGLTMAQHEEAGKRLKRMLSEIIDLKGSVINNYNITQPRAKRITTALVQMNNKLQTVRSELEELMAEQYPSEWETKVYYGQDGFDIQKLDNFAA